MSRCTRFWHFPTCKCRWLRRRLCFVSRGPFPVRRYACWSCRFHHRSRTDTHRFRLWTRATGNRVICQAKSAFGWLVRRYCPHLRCPHRICLLDRRFVPDCFRSQIAAIFQSDFGRVIDFCLIACESCSIAAGSGRQPDHVGKDSGMAGEAPAVSHGLRLGLLLGRTIPGPVCSHLDLRCLGDCADLAHLKSSDSLVSSGTASGRHLERGTFVCRHRADAQHGFCTDPTAQNLLFTVAVASISCSIAAIRAARAQMLWEAMLWLIVVFAIAINSSIFDFLRPTDFRQAGAILLCLVLAFGLATLAQRLAGSLVSVATFLPLLAAAFAIPALLPQTVNINVTPLNQLADWAEANTWGSSLFLFPDSPHSLEPGYFRAKSRRGLWVDWQGGVLADYSEEAASEWLSRWKQIDVGRFTPPDLEQLLPLEIDYYVLQRPHALRNVKPVFENSRYVVYDATDLQNTPGPLRFAAVP